MELYGIKAWALVGLAVVGWALAVLFLLTALANYNQAVSYYNGLALCLTQYRALASNYTALANQSLTVAKALGNLTLANIYTLNQTITLLNNVYYELEGLNNTLNTNNAVLGQALIELRAVNQTLTANNQLLMALVRAVNQTNH